KGGAVPAAPTPAAKAGAPAALPAPAVVDAPPVPGAPAVTPTPASGFATMPRSSDPPPGRPPAFRLLVPAKHTEPPAGPPPVVPPERPVEAPPVVSAAQTPVLTLDKRGPATVRVGQPLAYELVVRNAGTVPARQVRIEDELPAGTRFISAEPMASVQADR